MSAIVLETDRMYLRELEYTDKEVLARIYSDEEVMRYIGMGVTIEEEKIPLVIDHWKRSYAQNGFGLWGVVDKANDMLIGHCGLAWLHDNSDIELAYLLYKDHWGKGIASEISIATLHYAQNVLGLKRIVALVYPQNLASIRVIEKMGMQYECEITIPANGVVLYKYKIEQK